MYSKNFDKKEIILNFDASKEEKLPNGWEEVDNIKVLGEDDYPIDIKYKLIKI